MGDSEWENAMRALATELASKPNRAYRTWTLRVEDGKASFELSKIDIMLDQIMDEAYPDTNKTANGNED